MKKNIKIITYAILSAMILAAVVTCFTAAVSATGKAGDVNCDGAVDNGDVSALFAVICGKRSAGYDLTAADCTGDKKINNKDVILLIKHLADNSVVLHYDNIKNLDNVYIEWDESVSGVVSAKQTKVSFSSDGLLLTSEKSGTNAPQFTLKTSEYASAKNKRELKGSDGRYVVFRIKSNADGYLRVYSQKNTTADSSSALYTPDNEFHYVLVDMTKTKFVTQSKITSMRVDWTTADAAEGSTMTISEIGFFSDKAAALKYIGENEEALLPKSVTYAAIPNGADSADCFTADDMTIEPSSDGAAGTVTLKSSQRAPRVTVNLLRLANKNGGTMYKGRYLVIRVRLKDQPDASVYLNTVTDVSGSSTPIRQTTTVDRTTDKWQGVLYDLRDFAFVENALAKLNVVFTGFNADGNIKLGAIVSTDDLNEALKACEMSDYCLNYDYTLSDNDPLANTVVKAENEDDTFLMWFDQSTEKVNRNVVKPTTRTGYTVRMAKNETENCQFFVSPKNKTSVEIKIDEFKNENGKTVPFELYYEYYHNIEGTMMPDALPPYTMPVEVNGGESQGFLIQLTTAPDTEAGTYYSFVHVYDAKSGKEIKRAAVAVKVWNFALSDKTAIRTAFALWGGYVLDSYNWERVDFSDVEVMDNYFEFFLKYRINIMDNPHGLTSGYAANWMKQDRVNTARWNYPDMNIADDNGGVTPEWVDKVIYYPGEIDEPRTNDHFAKMADIYNRIKSNTEEFKMVAPFERNLNLSSEGKIVSSFDSADMDQIEYMSQYLNIWCPTLNAFTTRNLSFISRVSYIQSEQQDAKYGTFAERMKKEVEEGDELWTYICINPKEPYVNWQILSDGTETIVSLWQMKEYNITGMLYWAVNYWKVNYWGQSQPWTGNSYGDGMLIYSGYSFGLPCPIASIRLEGIRDGIEDYQMLCMLEEALGEQAAAEMVSRVTTSVVTFTSDDDYLHAVRVLLGDTLEAALNK